MKIGTLELGQASLHIGYSQLMPKQRDKIREITEFIVPEGQRGNGFGTELLKDVCAQADQLEITLLLKADTERLENYYKRFDFVTIQTGSDILMARQPKRA
jgi:N-acetylglutamate synthase-like GNAT family acetyltransferase